MKRLFILTAAILFVGCATLDELPSKKLKRTQAWPTSLPQVDDSATINGRPAVKGLALGSMQEEFLALLKVDDELLKRDIRPDPMWNGCFGGCQLSTPSYFPHFARFGGARPERYDLTYFKSGLEGFSVIVNSADYRGLREAMIQKYGPPSDFKTTIIETAAGRQLRSEHLTWQFSHGDMIELKEHSARITWSLVEMYSAAYLKHRRSVYQRRLEDDAGKL